MKKILSTLTFLLILLVNQDSAYSARVHSLNAEEEKSEVSSSESKEKKEDSSKEDSAKEKKHKSDEKSLESSKSESKENKEQIKLMSFGEIHQKIKSIDWLSLIIKLVRIIVIIMVARAVWKVLKVAIEKHLNKLLVFHNKKNTDVQKSPLFKTVVPIIESIAQWAIIILTALIVLSDMGVDITPIVLSFSVIGLAFSFGSQELVKDLINGVLTLFDGNISVGDFVKVGSSNGVVESISLRAIILRHATGELQTIPFSEAKSVINCSRDFNNAEFSVSVSPESNMDDVHHAFYSVYAALKSDAKLGARILGELSEIGVQSMTVSGIVVVSGLKILPDPEKEFAFEFNKRLFVELQKRKVAFAYNPLLHCEAKKESANEGSKEGGNE